MSHLWKWRRGNEDKTAHTYGSAQNITETAHFSRFLFVCRYPELDKITSIALVSDENLQFDFEEATQCKFRCCGELPQGNRAINRKAVYSRKISPVCEVSGLCIQSTVEDSNVSFEILCNLPADWNSFSGFDKSGSARRCGDVLGSLSRMHRNWRMRGDFLRCRFKMRRRNNTMSNSGNFAL